MPTHLKNTHITFIHPLNIPAPPSKPWTIDQVTKWIQAAGGKASPGKFIEGETTHVVCSEQAWQGRHHVVKAALAANEKNADGDEGSGRVAVKIVRAEWLEVALDDGRKPAEGGYLWERLGKGKGKGKVGEAGSGIGGARMGRSTQGMMAEVLEDATAPFISAEERAKLDARAREGKAAAERERLEAEAQRRREKEGAAVLRRQAKRARNEIFSDHHHIYTDATGFKHDVLLTKVDTRQNRNERYALTIYESNAPPHTYATNLHFAGTNRLPSNNVLAAIGCNFVTAFRAFRKVFLEKTGVDWNDRVGFAFERARKGKHGASGDGGREGKFDEVLKKIEECAFEENKFSYFPPTYGPRGVLPEGVKQKFPEVGPAARERAGGGVGEEDEEELWMRGPESPRVGNGENVGGDFVTGAEVEGNPDFEQFMSGALASAGEGGEGGDGGGTTAAPATPAAFTDNNDNYVDEPAMPYTEYPFGDLLNDGQFRFDDLQAEAGFPAPEEAQETPTGFNFPVADGDGQMFEDPETQASFPAAEKAQEMPPGFVLPVADEDGQDFEDSDLSMRGFDIEHEAGDRVGRLQSPTLTPERDRELPVPAPASGVAGDGGSFGETQAAILARRELKAFMNGGNVETREMMESVLGKRKSDADGLGELGMRKRRAESVGRETYGEGVSEANEGVMGIEGEGHGLGDDGSWTFGDEEADG